MLSWNANSSRRNAALRLRWQRVKNWSLPLFFSGVPSSLLLLAPSVWIPASCLSPSFSSLCICSPLFPLSFSFALSLPLSLNNSGAERSPEASEGPKLNRPNLASDPGAATRPLGGGLQCIPGESIVKAKHFLWSRASPTTITFHTFISLARVSYTQYWHKQRTDTHAWGRTHTQEYCKTLFWFFALVSLPLLLSASKCSYLCSFSHLVLSCLRWGRPSPASPSPWPPLGLRCSWYLVFFDIMSPQNVFSWSGKKVWSEKSDKLK